MKAFASIAGMVALVTAGTASAAPSQNNLTQALFPSNSNAQQAGQDFASALRGFLGQLRTQIRATLAEALCRGRSGGLCGPVSP